MLNNDHESFAAAQARAAAAASCESVVLPSGLTVLCRPMPGRTGPADSAMPALPNCWQAG